ncbi:hypothetical protein [Sphingomonas profundi]|uniref:hypothetical protein n=1 Tax=Alterirhizorhabdus profundi TaxID=2681549 RepID=UPI0018D07F5E|nr:hypothetical protein [Sphingomonas profundi]
MPVIYVLDVPEFRALADVARANSACRVTATPLGYIRIASDGDIVFDRRELGFKPAIWYGAFTGGIEGRIAEFGRDTVRIVADEGAAA